MARRRLSPDEHQLWSAVARTVKPLRPQAKVVPPEPASEPQPVPTRPVKASGPPVPILPTPARVPVSVLDNGWEKRIRGGAIQPDMSIDLHGHSLAAAHAQLGRALGSALARGVRVLLVVTGKPREDNSRRGAIRAEIGHWLETSAYADRIASVRVAHPRHGGDGALYVILRRRK